MRNQRIFIKIDTDTGKISNIRQIDAVLAFVELFFTNNSYSYKYLKQLLRLCKSNNKYNFRIKVYLDNIILPKFLFSIDDRKNNWLSEY